MPLNKKEIEHYIKIYKAFAADFRKRNNAGDQQVAYELEKAAAKVQILLELVKINGKD